MIKVISSSLLLESTGSLPLLTFSESCLQCFRRNRILGKIECVDCEPWASSLFDLLFNRALEGDYLASSKSFDKVFFSSKLFVEP